MAKGDDELYDFADEPAPKSSRVPTSSVKAGAGAVASEVRSQEPGRVQALQYRPAATAPKSDAWIQDQTKDLYMPLGLIAVAIVIRVGYVLIFGGRGLRGGVMTLRDLGLEMVGGSIVMLVAVLIASKVRSIQLGKLPIAMLKLCAVAVVPKAASIMLSPIFIPLTWLPYIGLLAGLGGPAIEFVAYFALLGALFDLDESDTWYCTLILVIVSIATYFMIQHLF